MTRARVTDSAGLVLLILAAWLWWAGFPDPPGPLTTAPGWAGPQPETVLPVTRGILAALLGTCAIAAFGILVTNRRAPERVIAVVTALMLLAGLAAVQVVSGVLAVARAQAQAPPTFPAPVPPLAGLTPTTAVAATVVGLTGVALLLAGVARRPRAVAAALLAVAAVALVADQVVRWLIVGSGTGTGTGIGSGLLTRALLPDALVAVLLAAGALAIAAGLQREPGALAREAALGATVLWGVVILVSALVPARPWQGLSGGVRDPAAFGLGSSGLGAAALLAAPAAAVLVARMGVQAASRVVTARWRGACAALTLLLLDRVGEPLGTLLLLVELPGAQVEVALVLWLVLSTAAAAGFAVAAARTDPSPWICAVAALLSVSSVVVVEFSGGAGVWLPETFVVDVLAPAAVALALAVRARRERRDRRPVGTNRL